MQRLLLLALALLFLAKNAAAQDLPNTNVYVLDMDFRDSVILFKEPKFLTDFNRNGYNNQPAFLSNSEVLMTVQLEGDSQTDIYLFDLERKTKLRLTKTAESEYSPKPAPSDLYFSVVRVETDAERSQRLWQYPLDRADSGKPVFRFLRGIGYYQWLDAFNVALFNIGQSGNFLSVGNTRDGSTRQLSPNIGRTFGVSPNGRLVFVHKVTSDRWVIKAMDKSTMKTDEIIRTLPGSEDFVILSNGTLLMGNGSRLYAYHPNRDSDWVEMVDLKSLGIYNITRMDARGRKLVLVSGGE